MRWAAARGHVEVVRVLLREYGAVVNAMYVGRINPSPRLLSIKTFVCIKFVGTGLHSGMQYDSDYST